jgi:hypothetical protein
MSKRTLWFQLVLLGLGGALLYIGGQLGQPTLTQVGISLGIFSIGTFVLVSGVQAIVTKKMGFEPRRPNFGPRELYTGLTAQLWGILFIAFAVLLFILAGVTWLYPGGAEVFWADLLGSPLGWGIVLLCIGLTVVTTGIIRLLAGSAGYYTGLADFVERISGVIPLLIGSGMTTIGLLLIVVPEMVMSLAQQMITSIGQWIFH